MEAELTLDGVSKERDFYFGKLRDIEDLCQQPAFEDKEEVKAIVGILHATAEGFEVPEAEEF